MKLHEQLVGEVTRALENKGAFQPCAMCGRSEWVVLPFAVKMLTSSTVEGLAKSTSFLPFVSVACSNCGNTHTLLLHLLGLDHLIPKDWYEDP